MKFFSQIDETLLRMEKMKTYVRPEIMVVTVEYDRELLFTSGKEGSIPRAAKAATFYDEDDYEKE